MESIVCETNNNNISDNMKNTIQKKRGQWNIAILKPEFIWDASINSYTTPKFHLQTPTDIELSRNFLW